MPYFRVEYAENDANPPIMCRMEAASATEIVRSIEAASLRVRALTPLATPVGFVSWRLTPVRMLAMTTLSVAMAGVVVQEARYSFSEHVELTYVVMFVVIAMLIAGFWWLRRRATPDTRPLEGMGAVSTELRRRLDERSVAVRARRVSGTQAWLLVVCMGAGVTVLMNVLTIDQAESMKTVGAVVWPLMMLGMFAFSPYVDEQAFLQSVVRLARGA